MTKQVIASAFKVDPNTLELASEELEDTSVTKIEQRVAEACAKMIQGWSCTNGPSIAEAIRSGKWREYL